MLEDAETGGELLLDNDGERSEDPEETMAVERVGGVLFFFLIRRRLRAFLDTFGDESLVKPMCARCQMKFQTM